MKTLMKNANVKVCLIRGVYKFCFLELESQLQNKGASVIKIRIMRLSNLKGDVLIWPFILEQQNLDIILSVAV